MFERKIEETIAYLLKQTISDQETITSRQIFASEVPTAVKRMFELDVDVWVEEEKARLLQSPHFRYDETAVQQLFERIISGAREYAVFTRDEYRETLEKNVKLLFNYLCRPQYTLVKYLFADREHAPADSLINGLKYFWNYEYYRIILSEYFSKKDISVMNAKKFGELLEHIDQEVVRNFDSRKLAHLAEPIFDLFAIGTSAEDKFVPVEALSIFYDDKNLPTIIERLDREKEQREQITLHDLVMLISEVDFTMSFDISAIVNQHVHGMEPMKPEREATAGKDFDVPEIDSPVSEEEEDRKEIGHEDDDLDFIISDEENAVIEHAYDSIPEMEDDLIVIDEDADTDDDVAAQTDYTGAPLADEEILPDIEDDGDAFIAGDEDEELMDDLPPSEPELLEEDSAGAITGTEESILDLEMRLGTQDDIPDMDYLSEDANEVLDVDDVNDSGDYGLSMDDDEPANLISDDIPEISFDTDDDMEEEAADEGDLNIDWDAEAEDMPDIKLDDTEDDRGKLTDELIPGIALGQEDQLKPAEELLGQLDLDDFDTDEQPAEKASSQYDIPIIEDESPPPPTLSGGNGVEAEEEPAIPVEQVIAEYGDLNQMISGSDKKKYVKKLFQKDEEAYTRAILVINGKPNWREASEYIDELFIKHDVDMYSRLAVKFTDDIYKRYLNKS